MHQYGESTWGKYYFTEYRECTKCGRKESKDQDGTYVRDGVEYRMEGWSLEDKGDERVCHQEPEQAVETPTGVVWEEEV